MQQEEIKYDRIGINYNLTRKADAYLSGRLRFHLDPVPSGLYLDIGCGTGNYTIELARHGHRFIGIDPSLEMLETAKGKDQSVDWRKGTAEATGLPDTVVDGVVCTLTIHHWTDLDKAFFELNRILKANGRIVIFTSTPEQMKGYWLNHYFPKMLNDSILQMPSLETVGSALEKNGFKIIEMEKYTIRPDLEDHFLYCGKLNPEIYFNETVRHGISSFSALANMKETEKGLAELRADVDSGKIHAIIRSSLNNAGDYLFIVAGKTSQPL